MAAILDELRWRGLLYDLSEGLAEKLAHGPVTLYNGFDPTADSLHVGHMVPLLCLARFQRFGHTPIALAGGGTGLIGDPSGKSSERQLLSKAQVEANVEAIKQQLARFIDFNAATNPARLVNNADWLTTIPMVDFMRDVGKHLTVNYMLAKDSVKSRLSSETGISFTEFSYMLLQSYDFVHLYEQHNCVLQTGGSDQWGNITAGVELIRRSLGEKAYGLVYPLITKADGSKFGKTEGGAIWLDPQRTSPYKFYQFWYNTDDADVIKYLKFFTFLSESEVQELDQAVRDQPGQRAAQLRLAREMTAMVHGESALARAEEASRALFGGSLQGLSAADIADVFDDVPASNLPHQEFAEHGLSMIDLLSRAGVVSSRSEARRLVEGGGVYLNNQQASLEQRVGLADAIAGQFLVIRRGRRNYHLVRITE